MRKNNKCLAKTPQILNPIQTSWHHKSHQQELTTEIWAFRSHFYLKFQKWEQVPEAEAEAKSIEAK